MSSLAALFLFRTLRRFHGQRSLACLLAAGCLVLLSGGPSAQGATPVPVPEPTPVPASPTAPAASPVADDVFRAETSVWQRRRLERLLAEDGWLTLVGLDWLEAGANTFGSDPGNRVVLRAAGIPPVAGTLVLAQGRLHASVLVPGSVTVDGHVVDEIDLQDDVADAPTVLQLGNISIQVVKRGERWAARVKDSASPVRTGFKGLEWFAADQRFRVEATLLPYPPGKTLPIANIVGLIEEQPCPGVLAFELLGQPYRLEPVQEDDSGELFLMMADATSGRETYGAGRYVVVSRDTRTGRWVIDFNRAYNPPCAFTAFATCPLPPKGNRLPLRITAGEKRYAGGRAD